MRILFVATEYPERGIPTTGFPNYLKRVSLALARMGHEPLILAAGNRRSHRVEQGIEIWTERMEYNKFIPQTLCDITNSLKKGYILNRKVEEIIKSRSVDVIQYTSLEGIAMFYKGDVPAVLRLSSYAKTYFHSFRTFSPIKVGYISLMERYSARKCSMIFAPCRITAQAFGKDCKRKVKVIETPFVNDVEQYDSTYIDKYLKDKTYALFFGSLYAEKGILVIAEILERFLQHNPCYYFVFIGDIWKIGDESALNILKRKAGKHKDRIIVWNALPHKMLYPIIKAADFVVLPSLMDNFPNACIEAMYFGKVVIGTEGASFEQLITHARSGLLCRIGDSEDLLEKMQEAVSMSEEQKIRMGKMARIRTDKLKPEIVVEELLRLYQYVIDNNKKKTIH